MTSETHKASRETAKAAIVSQSKISKIELGAESLLPQSEITRSNVREEFFKCRMIIEGAKQSRDYEILSHYKERLAQIESKMTPEQFSLEMDFLDVHAGSDAAYKEVLAKVKAQEANPTA